MEIGLIVAECVLFIGGLVCIRYDSAVAISIFAIAACLGLISYVAFEVHLDMFWVNLMSLVLVFWSLGFICWLSVNLSFKVSDVTYDRDKALSKVDDYEREQASAGQ